jgi:hypothetical protein
MPLSGPLAGEYHITTATKFLLCCSRPLNTGIFFPKNILFPTRTCNSYRSQLFEKLSLSTVNALSFWKS